MSTVFTLGGFWDITPYLGGLGIPSAMSYQLKSEVTQGNTVVPILYPTTGLDSLLLAFQPQLNDDALTSINTGRDMLDTALHATSGTKVVFGHSLGAIVATSWLKTYGPTSSIPAGQLSFVLIGNSVRKYGGLLYSIDYDIHTTPYQVRDMRAQYDGWADFPDDHTSKYRLLAVNNANIGQTLVHPFGYVDMPLNDPSYSTYTEGNIHYVFMPKKPWWQPDYVVDEIEQAYNRPELEAAPSNPTLSSYNSNLAVRYPAGPITPAGAHHLLRDRIPQSSLLAHDNSVVFNWMGGLAYHDVTRPERVELKDLDGLVPPWQTIDQKGATQDGTTFVTALYDPAEVTAKVVVHGRNPAMCRKTMNHLIGSIDAIKTSELSWTTHELGRWWANVRWFKNPAGSVHGGSKKRQEMDLRLRADDAFWRSYPNVDQFSFTYSDINDQFNIDDPDDLGTGWTLSITGPGSGGWHVAGGMIVSTLQANKTAVARKNSFTTTSNNQVVEIQFGAFPIGIYPFDGYTDIWFRLKNSGTPGTDGMRMRISFFSIRVSYFVAGVETVLREQLLIIPPLPTEKFSVSCGSDDNDRVYTVRRGDAVFMTFQEQGTGSPLGPGFRSTGIGQHSDSLYAATMPSILRFAAGDNATVSQTGQLIRVNMGDQPMWDNFTCFGPGLFRFGDGPGSSAMVEFGPLLAGQIMQIRTDPRKRGVVDLTSIPPTPQDLNLFQKSLQDFISFATGNNVPPLLQSIESIFGISPPQGNPYSMMKGRFSKPIPPRSPGQPPEQYLVNVEIENGTTESKVIAAGTPLRRNPY